MCFYLHVCVCVMSPICILITTEAKEGTRALGAVVIGGCELSNTGARNEPQVLWND